MSCSWAQGESIQSLILRISCSPIKDSLYSYKEVYFCGSHGRATTQNSLFKRESVLKNKLVDSLQLPQLQDLPEYLIKATFFSDNGWICWEFLSCDISDYYATPALMRYLSPGRYINLANTFSEGHCRLKLFLFNFPFLFSLLCGLRDFLLLFLVFLCAFQHRILYLVKISFKMKTK